MKKMKFHVDTLVTKCTQRLGILSDIESKPNIVINTPAVMLHTQGGQIPHITHEVFKLISKDPQILQIPLASVHTFKEAMQYYEGTITEFVGSKDTLSCLTLQDPSSITKQGHNASFKVPVFTRTGKCYYDTQSYMDLVETCKPDLYCFLSDEDTNISSSDKRVTKSVTNSIHFFNECLERHRKSEVLKNSFVLAPIMGGFKLQAREKFIDVISKDLQDIGGVLIDGLFNNGAETEFVNFSEIQSVVHFVIEKLPSEKLRCIQGCWNPVTILSLVECGIDVFDTSYCHILTERSAAMTFSVDSTDESNTYEINLRDEKFADDFQPPLIGCQCLACSKYSRAYIHHLLSVHELLGPILIMIHNIHHYLRFFEKIRQCIQNNTLNSLQLKISEQFRNHEQSLFNNIQENGQTSNGAD